ncbi:MAG TPA: response regulator, partial [Terriglobales bacterium]
MKILFADDSMTAQNMGKKILSDAGYEVVAVSNGAAALKKINELKPELVVLDIYMPGYTGLEVCEKMRSAHETSNTPVILTHGKMEAYKPEDGARVKADGVIVKPFEATDLLAAIEKLASNVKAASAAKASQAQKTVTMPPPGAEAEASDVVEEILPSKPPSVSVPSEMASHAAYGVDDLLSSAQSQAPPASASVTPAVAFESAPVAPAISLASAQHSQSSVAPPSENSLETEFAVSPVQISTPELGASTSFNSGFREPEVVQEETAPANPAKPSLLERFDAILKGGVSAPKSRDFEATAAEPAPDLPVATDPELEITGQKIETGSIEIVREPGLDPFSSEATATGQADYQSWDTTESSTQDTNSPQYYAEPEAHAQIQSQMQAEAQAASVSEPAVLSPETDFDDFEKRVAEAMADFQSSATGQEHEIASAITEREAEDAEFERSKYAVAHETDHGHAHATNPPSGETPFYVAPVPDLEITDAISESTAETYVLEDPTDNMPAKAAAAAAPAGNSELERALAEAVAAQNHKVVAAAHSEAPIADAAAVGDSMTKPVEATMITKIVTRVLEHSLPEILNRVMTELEKEEREKKK